MKRQAENFHVVVGMTSLIKMPSYWFGDVLAVVFHIQKMFAEALTGMIIIYLLVTFMYCSMAPDKLSNQ